MEITGITNYTFEEFLFVEQSTAANILPFLEWLEPIKEFEFDNQLIQLKELDSLTFGQVSNIRDDLTLALPDNLIEITTLVTGLEAEKAYQIPIIDFFGIINTVKAEEKVLAAMELNELSEEPDADWELAGGSEKMGRFGILNILDSLAGGDITKWETIENLPYMTVFSKLRMNKTMTQIQRAIASIQKQRQQNK